MIMEIAIVIKQSMQWVDSVKIGLHTTRGKRTLVMRPYIYIYIYYYPHGIQYYDRERRKRKKERKKEDLIPTTSK